MYDVEPVQSYQVKMITCVNVSFHELDYMINLYCLSMQTMFTPLEYDLLNVCGGTST